MENYRAQKVLDCFLYNSVLVTHAHFLSTVRRLHLRLFRADGTGSNLRRNAEELYFFGACLYIHDDY